MYIGLHVKYPAFLSDFNKIWIFPTDFSKNTRIKNFMKIRQVGAELFQADGRTDIRTWRILTVAFHNFANAPKKHISDKGDRNGCDEICSRTTFCPALP